LGKIQNLKVGGRAFSEKKVGEPKPMRPPRFRHLWAYAAPSFAGHSFVLFQVKRVTICQFTVVHFDFCFISNIISFRYACISLE